MKKITKQGISLVLAVLLTLPAGPLSARAENALSATGTQANPSTAEPDNANTTPVFPDNSTTDGQAPAPLPSDPQEPGSISDDGAPVQPGEPQEPGTVPNGTVLPSAQSDDGQDAEPPLTDDGTASLPDNDSEPDDGSAALEASIKKSKGAITEAKVVAGGISVTWAKIEGAEGYYLERKLSGNTWKSLKTVKGEQNTSYIDAKASPDKTYYYRVTAYINGGDITGKVSAAQKVVYVTSPSLNTEISYNSIQLRWNRPASAAGYYVYRRLSTKSKWTKVYTITQPGEISWRDTTAKNGYTYAYVVTAFNGDSESLYSNEKSYVRVTAPTVKSLMRKSATKLTVTWKANTSASGYQIQYSKTSWFSGVKKVTLRNASKSSYTLSGLAKNQNYYVRIRAFKKQDGKTYFSAWAASSNIKSTRTAKATILKKGKKTLELRSFAKQVMYQYDVLQGSCTDGVYSYYMLLNKNNYYSKIVKIKHSTRKVVLVSQPLNVGSGNDMTYNADKNILVIVHCSGADPKALTSVDPKTLTVTEGSRHITLPNKLAGGTTADAKAATAFSGIAYNSSRKQYAVLLSHNYNFILLDAEMNPIQYVKASKKNDYKIQGIDATNDYIFVAQSPKYASQAYNIITVYDWDGNYISKINVKKGYEIESIFHIGSKYYASFYRSYYKTCYKTVTKKVTVNGQIKKKKIKKKYTAFMRDNYVYRISGI